MLGQNLRYVAISYYSPFFAWLSYINCAILKTLFQANFIAVKITEAHERVNSLKSCLAMTRIFLRVLMQFLYRPRTRCCELLVTLAQGRLALAPQNTKSKNNVLTREFSQIEKDNCCLPNLSHETLINW